MALPVRHGEWPAATGTEKTLVWWPRGDAARTVVGGAASAVAGARPGCPREGVGVRGQPLLDEFTLGAGGDASHGAAAQVVEAQAGGTQSCSPCRRGTRRQGEQVLVRWLAPSGRGARRAPTQPRRHSEPEMRVLAAGSEMAEDSEAGAQCPQW